MRPWRFTSSTTRFPSPMVRVIGFSHQMSLPARAASTDIRRMPVRRRGDVHHVHVLAQQDLAEVGVAPDVGPRHREHLVEVLPVHVTHREQPRALVADVAAAHAADADDRLRQLVARRREAGAAEHVPRHDHEAGGCRRGALQEASSIGRMHGCSRPGWTAGFYHCRSVGRRPPAGHVANRSTVSSVEVTRGSQCSPGSDRSRLTGRPACTARRCG